MRPLLAKRSEYSRTEYLSDVAVHVLGLITVIAGVPALIVAASLTSETAAPVAGTVLYGVCFMERREEWRHPTSGAPTRRKCHFDRPSG